MTPGRGQVAQYLRQLGELGGGDIFLDQLGRDEAVRLVRESPSNRPRAGRVAPDAILAAAGSADRVGDPETPSSDASPPKRRPHDDADAAMRLTVLNEIGQRAAACTLCRLHESRRAVVFGEGDPAADLVIVGEAPGQEEDRTGRPFVGRAGRLLDLLLAAIGFPRERVYICNVLKCRPPQNRNPAPDEADMCTSHYLHAQIEAIGPRALLAVGKFAIKALVSSDDAVGRLRGRIHSYRGTPVVVSYHPAFLLRSPNMIRSAWADLQLVRTVLDEQS